MTGYEQDTSPLDREYLLSIADGDDEFIAELAMAYLQSSVNVMAELQEAVHQEDAHRIEQAAHALKGSCRAIGGNNAGDAFEAIELSARGKDLTRIEDQLREASTRYDSLVTYMRGVWPVAEVIS